MVFMKKGATPSKNQQVKKGKKPVQVQEEEVDMDFDDMDDSDDDDSDEAPQLQKTPANKGAKGRMSMSEKKVSFSIPGKNSPAVKTPKKDSSILSKKQPTPANKGVKQEDSDDDDEDDDDFDIEEGDEEDDDLADMDDLDEDDDDDDEDDEEGDEDDDSDEDDDEDDEDKNAVQKKLAALKQKNGQQKTPVKENDKAKKAAETPKEKKKEQKAASPKQTTNVPQIAEEMERRRLRDAKMLFVGGLPGDIKSEELKALSGDIVEVTLPNQSKKQARQFAFLTFNSEAKAESNYKSLQSKKLRGQPLTLDFVGAKSVNKKSEEQSGAFNMRKLFVSGLPLECTIDKVAKFFPMAYQIVFNQSPNFRTATISFHSEELAKFAYESNKEIEIDGHKWVVLYSKQGGGKALVKKRKHNRNKGGKKFEKKNSFGGNPNKKMKFSKKSEE